MKKQITIRLHPLADRDLIYLHQNSNILFTAELRKCLVAYAHGLPYSCPLIRCSSTPMPTPTSKIELHLTLDPTRPEEKATLDMLRLLPSGTKSAFIKQLFRYSLNQAPLQGFAAKGVSFPPVARADGNKDIGASQSDFLPTAGTIDMDTNAPATTMPDPMDQLIGLSGRDFEFFAAGLLLNLGFSHIEVTPASADQGADVIGMYAGKKYAIQCKHQIRAIGNDAIQEAYSGAAFYSADVAVVMTTSTFTAQAQMLANATGVVLWDKDVLAEMLDGKWNS